MPAISLLLTLGDCRGRVSRPHLPTTLAIACQVHFPSRAIAAQGHSALLDVPQGPESASVRQVFGATDERGVRRGEVRPRLVSSHQHRPGFRCWR